VITGASKINAAGTADTMTTFVLGQPMDAHSATDLGAFQGGNQDAGKGVRATLAFAMVQSVSLFRPIGNATLQSYLYQYCCCVFSFFEHRWLQRL
jgi:hypothetical protein